jgi:hypothetical protein
VKTVWIITVLSLLCLVPVVGAQDACAGLSPVPLVIGGRGRVSSGDANNVREQPARSSALIGQVPGDALFDVLDGPRCVDGLVWWQVSYAGITGWTVDGANGQQWLFPATIHDWEVWFIGNDTLYRVNANGLSDQITLPDHFRPTSRIALSPDRRWLAWQNVWESDQTIYLYDLQDRNCCVEVTTGAGLIGFDADGALILMSCESIPTGDGSSDHSYGEGGSWPCILISFDIQRQVDAPLVDLGYVDPYDTLEHTSRGIEFGISDAHCSPGDFCSWRYVPARTTIYDPISGDVINQTITAINFSGFQRAGDVLALTGEYVTPFNLYDSREAAQRDENGRYGVAYAAADQTDFTMIYYGLPIMTTHWVLDGNGVLIRAGRGDLLLRDGTLIYDMPAELGSSWDVIAGTPDGWLAHVIYNMDHTIAHVMYEQGTFTVNPLFTIPSMPYGLQLIYQTPLGATASGTFPLGEMPAG